MLTDLKDTHREFFCIPQPNRGDDQANTDSGHTFIVK